MALGAKRRDVVRLVLSSTSASVGVGLASGLVLTLIFDTVARQWLTETSRDPVVLSGLAVILIGVAALACFAPARRAASVDPSEALRYE
jgi:ABC-type antimicrobial peptide transport system permease subunit